MKQIIEKVDTITFQGHRLDIYGDIKSPLFLAVDVAEFIDYSGGNTGHMLEYDVDDEEIFYFNVERPYRRKIDTHSNGARLENEDKIDARSSSTRLEYKIKSMAFITKYGLYDVLRFSRKPIARAFQLVIRRVLKEKEQQYENYIEMWNDFDDIADEEIDDWNTHYEERFGMTWNQIMTSDRY